MAQAIDIREFKTYFLIKRHYHLFEVAQIAEHTMAKGVVAFPKDKIKFRPLSLNSYEAGVFDRLRHTSTPKFKETAEFGKVLVYDNYMLRLKK